VVSITERFEQANNVHVLADILYVGIEEVIQGLQQSGCFVDNGIAAIPYETIDWNSEEEKNEVANWELSFLRRATMLAYQRWIDENK
jgi:hypothetical protein